MLLQHEQSTPTINHEATALWINTLSCEMKGALSNDSSFMKKSLQKVIIKRSCSSVKCKRKSIVKAF